MSAVPYLTWIVAAGSLVIAGWAGIRTIRDQPVIFVQLKAAAVVLAILLVTMIVAGVQLWQGHTVAEPVMFWGYFISGLILLPVAGVWSVAERTRWSSVVLLVAAVATAVVVLRLHFLWIGG